MIRGSEVVAFTQVFTEFVLKMYMFLVETCCMRGRGEAELLSGQNY